MQAGLTAFDVASIEGHINVCQELQAQYFLWAIILCDNIVYGYVLGLLYI